MALPQDRRLDPQGSLVQALKYSSQFKFPLTRTELWLWQPGTSFSPEKFSFWPHQSAGYYYLPGRKSDIKSRISRVAPSQEKLNQARKTSDLLRHIPTIQAVYLTGSAAVNNSSEQDDVDLMIISTSNCIWVTRLLVVLLLTLFSLRRPSGHPEHSSDQVANKICDNLYLDENFLTLPHNPVDYSHSLYLAHEILQAIPIWYRSDAVPARFLIANSWTRDYLPVIYKHLSRKFKLKPSQQRPPALGTFILNICLFIPQYIYMRSHLTNESVSLHSAFFHPNQHKTNFGSFALT